jgi:hypothetical protein
LTAQANSGTITSVRILPSNALHKLGIILGTAILTSAAGILVAVAALFGANRGWFELGENGPWLPIIGPEYGFLLGIVIGVIICIMKSRSRSDRAGTK